MDCGPTDYLCQLSGFLSQWAPGLLDWIKDTFETLRPHLPWLIALVSTTVGIVKWLQSRDSVTFKRLAEIIREDDDRLHHSRSDQLQIISRPGPERTTFDAPLYAVQPLRQVLRQRRWAPVFGLTNPAKRADRRLESALVKLQDQIAWTEARRATLRKQLAAAHLLKGAVASARSGQVTATERKLQFNRAALAEFNYALAVPDNGKGIDAWEHKGHQLRKLNYLDPALQAFQEMEALATALQPSKQRSLYMARAKKFQAEIHKSNNPAAPNANAALIAAVTTLEPLAPLTGRDLLDQAEIHEMHAAVRFAMGANIQAPLSLGAARSDYETLLASLGLDNPGAFRRIWRWLRTIFRHDGAEEIRQLAKAGLKRVDLIERTGQSA